MVALLDDRPDVETQTAVVAILLIYRAVLGLEVSLCQLPKHGFVQFGLI
jgi:hypothetical protein